MKLLYVACTPRDPEKGASGADIATIEALRNLGHDVDEVWEHDMAPRRVVHGNLHQLCELPHRFANVVEKMTRKTQYDVVQVNEAAAWLAAKRHVRSGRSGIFVNRSHGWEPAGRSALEAFCADSVLCKTGLRRVLSKRLANLLARQNSRVLKYSTGVIVGSEGDRAWIRSQNAASFSRTLVLPLGVHNQILEPPQHAFTRERQKKLLYVGQFHPVKQPKIVGSVASQLLRLNSDLQFTWVCESVSHEDAAKLISPDVLPRVTFSNWMDKRALCSIFDQHGIFLFPSAYESFGMTFLEAMSRGLCVIASRVGGVPSIISNQQNGLICDVADQTAFLHAARLLIDDYERALAISKFAVETAQLYTWNRTARILETFYHSIRGLAASENSIPGF